MVKPPKAHTKRTGPAKPAARKKVRPEPLRANARTPARWRMLVLLNRKSGTMRTLGPEAVAKQVRQALAPVCERLDIELVDGAMPAELAAKIDAGIYDCVVVGGGDGSISSMAGRLAGGDVTLGALPLGTMNMIVRVLGFPQDLAPALAALATAEVRRIDLGEVNGETFVRQVSFGLQPRIARLREKFGYSSRLTKLISGLRAMVAVLVSPRNLHLTARNAGGETPLRSPAVIISNNEILGGEKLLVQDALDNGVLGLYALPPPGVIAIVRLTFAVLKGRWREDQGLTAQTATSIMLLPGRFWFRKPKQILCSLDGELRRLRFPVSAKIRPKSLNVLMPKAAP